MKKMADDFMQDSGSTPGFVSQFGEVGTPGVQRDLWRLMIITFVGEICHIILYYIKLYYIVLYYIMLCYIILYYLILYCIILYYVILYYVMSYYIILNYIILYYIILYYIILYIYDMGMLCLTKIQWNDVAGLDHWSF